MKQYKVFLYAEYQVSIPFDQIDWHSINPKMKTFEGLVSKTWLSGINTHTVGGFYEFTSLECARRYIKELLIPFAENIHGSLSVRLYNGDVVEEASKDMSSPYY